MDSRKNVLHAALLGVLSAGSALSQSEPVLTMNKVMNGEQLRATGIDTLTPVQRAALDRWISEYTVTIIGLAQRSADPTPKVAGSAQAAYLGSSGGHWIKSKAGNGSMIVLEDGSIWEISSIDRINTSLWLPITNITVLKAPQPMGDYKYVLVNKDDGEKALAKFIGRE
jgi:hypothetical protein